MNINVSRNQFLLTKEPTIGDNSQCVKIAKFNLLLGSDFSYASITKPDFELHLLGDLYDWENPQFSNNDILRNLSGNKSFEDILDASNKYFGDFIIIYVSEKAVYLFNDANAQREVYYDEEFGSFGTQPGVIGMVEPMREHTDPAAVQFYQSNTFKSKKIFLGESTHVENIKHLLPNHYINISEKKVVRFFPVKDRIELNVKEVAKEAASMFKGYMKSVSLRHKLLLGVTAGYDSRVLFLSSLGLECKYFINFTLDVDKNHYDYRIAKKLTGLYGKELVSIESDFFKVDYPDAESEQVYQQSVDFPRFLNIGTNTEKGEVIVNGNISEIARNYYGTLRNLSARDLSYIIGYSSLDLPKILYTKWLKNRKLFKKHGYHYLDMFYWEERMGIWFAKSKTETNAMSRPMVNPYNSRALLSLLLSTKRKHRDAHFNVLYDAIISELSDNNPKVAELPINPCKKEQVFRILKKMKLFSLYRLFRIKMGQL